VTGSQGGCKPTSRSNFPVVLGARRFLTQFCKYSSVRSQPQRLPYDVACSEVAQLSANAGSQNSDAPVIDRTHPPMSRIASSPQDTVTRAGTHSQRAGSWQLPPAMSGCLSISRHEAGKSVSLAVPGHRRSTALLPSGKLAFGSAAVNLTADWLVVCTQAPTHSVRVALGRP
jgi:hypothetical protein